jgi:hypothetical protein
MNAQEKTQGDGGTMNRPEMGWDRQAKTFTKNGKAISNADALKRWEACDADWSAGAHKRAQAMDLHGTRPDAPCHDE